MWGCVGVETGSEGKRRVTEGRYFLNLDCPKYRVLMGCGSWICSKVGGKIT